jgi:sulfofructose kinase
MKSVSLVAANRAKEMRVPVMIDAGRLREGMLDIAGLCDYIVASEEFAKELGYDGDAGKFRETLRKRGLRLTTITLGKKGSVTFHGSDTIAVPAYDVEQVDTTGAGDVFHGGYIFGLLMRWDIALTIRFASALAAMNCRKVGGRAGIPGLQEVAEFLRERGEDFPIEGIPVLKRGSMVD